MLARWSCCTGIRSDLRKRLPHYLSDWTEVSSTKILSGALFIFFTSIAPAITFSLYLSDSTKDELGAIEVLLSTAITGALFSFFSGQPLVIVGVTGPVVILTANIYVLAKSWGIHFIPFYAWAQIWAGIIQLILAVTDCCNLVRHVTQFSCDSFGALIAVIYLYTGLEGVADMFNEDEYSFSSGLLQFILAMGTALTSCYLSQARHWKIGNEGVRNLIADYGATLSIIAWSSVPSMASGRLAAEDEVPKLYVPLQFATTSGRSWLADLSDIPLWGVFAAILPGIIISILFFFDHNVSSIIAQHKEFCLRKGTAFHWDYVIVAVSCFLTGVLGIPPTNGLIPQSPLHTKALIVHRRLPRADGSLSHEFQVECVFEQRWTNLLQSLLTALGMISPFCLALRSIPTAVLYGLFLFLGVQSFEGNEFADRVELFFLDHSLQSSFRSNLVHLIEAVSPRAINLYTLIQLVVCAIIFGVTFTSAGVIFPVLIALLILLRLGVLPRLFTSSDLAALDRSVLSAEEQQALGVDVDVQSSKKLPRDSQESSGDLEVPATAASHAEEDVDLPPPSQVLEVEAQSPSLQA